MPNAIPQHDVRAVANYYINKACKRQDNIPFILDPLLLQTMVYTAHVAHAYYFNKSLCSEEYIDTEVAPYFPTLRDGLRFSDNNKIPSLLHDGNPADIIKASADTVITPISSIYTIDQKLLLDKIWNFFVEHNLHFAVFEKTPEQVQKQNLGITPRSHADNYQNCAVEKQQEMLEKEFFDESQARYGT